MSNKGDYKYDDKKGGYQNSDQSKSDQYKSDQYKSESGQFKKDQYSKTDQYKSQAIPLRESKFQYEYEVEEDKDTKMFFVHPMNYSSGEKRWYVEFSSKNDANAYRKDLLDGKVKSPVEEPHSYGPPRKGAHGDTLYYAYFSKASKAA